MCISGPLRGAAEPGAAHLLGSPAATTPPTPLHKSLLAWNVPTLGVNSYLGDHLQVDEVLVGVHSHLLHTSPVADSLSTRPPRPKNRKKKEARHTMRKNRTVGGEVDRTTYGKVLPKTLQTLDKVSTMYSCGR